MRIALIEVGHWHASMYINRLKDSGSNVVAVSDRNKEVVAKVGQTLGCRSYIDFHRLLEKEKPDFVFAFGVHSQMSSIARLLIEKRIPFAMEKPVGIDHQTIEGLADLAAENEVFNAIPLVFRAHPMTERLLALREQGEMGDFTHICLRYIAGPPDRYPAWGCEWMLHKDQAGGGCTINLGVHFIDLFCYLTGSRIKTVYGKMSNLLHRKEVEDSSTIVVESEAGAVGVIETAYGHPGTEQYYTFAGTEGYAVVHGNAMEYVSKKGERTKIDLEQADLYAYFVDHTLECFVSQKKPIADLRDICQAVKIVNLAYDSNLNNKICYNQ